MDAIIDDISDMTHVGRDNTPKVHMLITELQKGDKEFPQSMKIDFMAKQAIIPHYHEKGDTVRVFFSLRYVQHDNGRIYQNIKGYRVEKLDADGNVIDNQEDDHADNE